LFAQLDHYRAQLGLLSDRAWLLGNRLYIAGEAVKCDVCRSAL